MIQVKYTNSFLHLLEAVFAESDYKLRYEKGRFKSAYCLVNQDKIVMLNTYYPLESKINSLIEILRTLDLNTENLRPKTLKIYQQIRLNLESDSVFVSDSDSSNKSDNSIETKINIP